MNFGVKITVLYISFVVLILTLVFMSYGQKVELISPDYYSQEINFQQRINATNNEKKLSNSISHTINSKTIILKIDSSIIGKDFNGTINFYRPSDSSKDIEMKMNFVNNEQVIETKQFIHGAYKLQLSWVSNHTNYFKEEVIFIN